MNKQIDDEWRWGLGFWLSFGMVLLVTIMTFLVEYQITSASALPKSKFFPKQSAATMQAPCRAKLATDDRAVAPIASARQRCNVGQRSKSDPNSEAPDPT
jgi:hypothetical protein